MALFWDIILGIVFAAGTALLVLLYLAPIVGLAIFWYCRAQRRERRRQADLCPECAYELRGSTERCPECGTVIEACAEES